MKTRVTKYHNWKFFSATTTDGAWWIRLFGAGISWKNIKKHSLIFSERIGKRGLIIGNWCFRWLPYEPNEIEYENDVEIDDNLYMTSTAPSFTEDQLNKMGFKIEEYKCCTECENPYPHIYSNGGGHCGHQWE